MEKLRQCIGNYLARIFSERKICFKISLFKVKEREAVVRKGL